MKQSPEDKMAAAAAELRALIREAHETAQMLRQAMKAARMQVDEYHSTRVQQSMDEHFATVQDMVNTWHADCVADVLRHRALFNDALNAVVTVVEMDMQHDDSGTRIKGDVVIDLRGKAPKIALPGTPEADAILADAPYTVVVGPAAREHRRAAPPSGAVS